MKIGNMSMEAVNKLFGFMLDASFVTLKIFALTLLFGLPLGMIVCLLRMSKLWIIRWPIQIYLLIMRGTPLILQLMFWEYAPFYMFKTTMERFDAAIIGFVLNYAAYFAEIFRGGIESIPAGQKEAATVLGFTRVQTFFKIILPQVVKRVLPPMSNEFMTLIKDTSLAYVIGVAEMYQLATKNMSSQASIVPLVMAGVFYLVINLVIQIVFNCSEKRLNYYK